MTHNFFVIKNDSYYMTHVTKQFQNKQTCVGVAEIEEYPKKHIPCFFKKPIWTKKTGTGYSSWVIEYDKTKKKLTLHV